MRRDDEDRAWTALEYHLSEALGIIVGLGDDGDAYGFTLEIQEDIKRDFERIVDARRNWYY